MLTPEMIDQMVMSGQMSPEDAQAAKAQMSQQPAAQPGMTQRLMDYGKKMFMPQQTTPKDPNYPGQQAPAPSPSGTMQPMPSQGGGGNSGLNKATGAVTGAGELAAGVSTGNPLLIAKGGLDVASALSGGDEGPSTLEKKNAMLQYKQNKLNYKSNRGKYADQLANAFGDGIEGIFGK